MMQNQANMKHRSLAFLALASTLVIALNATLMPLHVNRDFATIKHDIETTPPLDVADPAVQDKMMTLLIAGNGNPTKNEILPGLDLGRGTDSENDHYMLAVAATAAGDCLPRVREWPLAAGVIELPVVEGHKDVGLESFEHDGQRVLHEALIAMDVILSSRSRVLVFCQQGKDRSALVVLAYLMAKFDVTLEQAYNFVQSKRPIVSTRDIPKYWNFLENDFIKPAYFL